MTISTLIYTYRDIPRTYLEKSGCFDGLMVKSSDFGLTGPGFESCLRIFVDGLLEVPDKFSNSLKNGTVEVGRGLLNWHKIQLERKGGVSVCGMRVSGVHGRVCLNTLIGETVRLISWVGGDNGL